MTLTRRILGIDFLVGNTAEAFDKAVAGGLTVVPAAPGLAKDFVYSEKYRQALLTADTAITDSGFMLLLWRLRTGERLPKNSGLAFLREWQRRLEAGEKYDVFWIMPSEEEAQRTRAWFAQQGQHTGDDHFYIAPFYGKGPYEDPALIAKLEAVRPGIVMVGLGGGVQECLGYAIRENLTFRPAIFCIGAAIAFLTGGQANIPVWADRMYLGWLFRILDNPRKFWRRYYEAFALAPIVWKYKDALPPMRS